MVIFEGAATPDVVDCCLHDFAYLRNLPQQFSLIVNEDGKPGDLPIAGCTPERLHQPGMRFVHMHTISKTAMLLSLCPNIALFLQHIFVGPPCVLQSLTFYRGSQQDIHIDYPYVFTQAKIAMLATSWVALEDVDPGSGPLVCYPGSHRVENIGFFDWGDGSVICPEMTASTNTGRPSTADFSAYLEMHLPGKGI